MEVSRTKLSNYVEQFKDAEEYEKVFRQCAGDCPAHLMKCPNNQFHLPDSFEDDRKYYWCVRVHCSVCDCEWFICKK